jgi:cellulose synthase/poly-beta-1,6-N-acetylglucosamine synthase-like glycosyltransferase
MRIFTIVVAVYTALYFTLGLTLYAFAVVELLRARRRALRSHARRIIRAPIVPAVTVLVPAHNEELVIAESVRSILALDYPKLSVVVTNDGSTDNTLGVLIDEFELRPVARELTDDLPHEPLRAVYKSEDLGLTVLDKEQGGRSDALNAAICAATTPLVCIIDADSVLEQDGLTQLIVPMLEDPAATIACGGIVGVGNGCRIERGQVVEVGLARNPLAMFQTLEYLRAFFFARAGLAVPNSLHLISGAFGLFRRDVLIEVGGLGKETVGEDFDLTMKLHRHALDRKRPYRIAYVSTPVCWTEVPERIRVLRAQRRRWGRGAAQVMVAHWAFASHPARYKRAWMFIVPTMALKVAGPPLILIGLVLAVIFAVIGGVAWPIVIAILAFWLVFGLMLTVAAFTLEDLSPRRALGWRRFGHLFLFAVLENFGYRQLVDLWHLEGMLTYRRVAGWGAMERAGFTSPAAHS